jgi:hypothetical protein
VALSCKKLFLTKQCHGRTQTEIGGCMYSEGLLMMSAWRSKYVELYTYRQKIKIYHKLHLLVYLLEYMKMHGQGNIKNRHFTCFYIVSTFCTRNFCAIVANSVIFDNPRFYKRSWEAHYLLLSFLNLSTHFIDSFTWHVEQAVIAYRNSLNPLFV